jgi:hypothetical protein
MKFILLLSALLLSISSYAQLTSTAKITTSDGRTFNVTIQNAVFKGTPQEFIIAGSGSALKQDQIAKVEYSNGEVLERHFISIETIPTAYFERDLSEYANPKNNFSGDKMVERILSGKISLFLYEDEYGFSHFFYLTNSDTALNYLPNRTYRDDQQKTYPSQKIYPDQSYKNLMLGLILGKNCPSSLTKRINDAEYNLKEITKIFEQINSCLGSNATGQAMLERKKDQFSIDLVAGVEAVEYDVYSRNLQPEAGISLNVSPGYGIRKTQFSLDIIYDRFSATIDSVQTTFGNSHAEVNISSISLNPIVRHFFNKESNKFFLEGGLNMRFLLNRQESLTSPTIVTKSDLEIGMQTGYILGAGYKWDKFSMSAGYTNVFSQRISLYNFFDLRAKFRIFNRR